MKHYLCALNETEIKALELIYNRGNRSYQQIAAELGITDRHLRRIREKPEFKEALRQKTLDELSEEVGEVAKVIAKKAKSGDYRFAELFVKLNGMLIDRQEIKQDTTITERLKYRDMTDAELERELEYLKARLEKYNDVINLDNYRHKHG